MLPSTIAVGTSRTFLSVNKYLHDRGVLAAAECRDERKLLPVKVNDNKRPPGSRWSGHRFFQMVAPIGETIFKIYIEMEKV